jgi:hypothetical protein
VISTLKICNNYARANMDNQSNQPTAPTVNNNGPGYKVEVPVTKNTPENIVQAASAQPGAINPLTTEPAQPTVIQSSLTTHIDQSVPNDYHTQYSAYSQALLKFRKRVVLTRILIAILILVVAYLVYYFGFLHPTGIYNKIETQIQNALSVI